MILFPGQGGQYTGMGYEIYKEFNEAKEIWNQLNDLLNEDFSDNVFHNEDFLINSRNIQLAISAYCLSIFHIIKNHIQYESAGGNSLGAQIALPIVESITYEQLFHIISYKGEMMDKVLNGGMISVLYGENVAEACHEIKDIYISNELFNGNMILSGTKESLQLAKATIKAKRIIDINVTGPFHSPLMKVAQDYFHTFMQNQKIQNAKFSLWSNVHCKPNKDANIIKQDMIDEMTNKLLFTNVVKQNDNFISIGGGKSMKAILRGKSAIFIDSKEDILNILHK